MTKSFDFYPAAGHKFLIAKRYTNLYEIDL